MLVNAKAHPGSKQLRIIWKDPVLHVYLTEPASAGKANAQLISLLAREFGGCRLLKGMKSGSKLLDLPTSLNRLENHV